MLDFSLDGHGIVKGRLHMPVCGAAVGEFEIDGDEALSGQVDLVLAGATLKMTVVEGGLSENVSRARLVAGAGGLGKEARGQHYWQQTAQMVVDSALQIGGERLSGTSDPSALTRTLEHWMRPRCSVGSAVARIADALGLTWRVLPDGTVWLGTPTWKPIDEIDYELLHEDLVQRTWLVCTEDTLIEPGTSLGGRHVVAVDHFVDASTWRSLVHYEEP